MAMSTGAPTAPLRLVLVTDSLDPSGVGRHMLTLAREFQASGRFERLVLALPGSADGDLLMANARRDGLAVKRLDLADQAGSIRWLRQLAPDLVHLHAGIGWEGHGLARLARDAEVSAVVRTEHLPYLLTDPAQRAEHADAMALVDRVICVSAGAAASHREAGIAAELLHAIPNGIRALPPACGRAEARERLGLRTGEPVLATVARLTEQKGHAVMVEAVARLVATRPDLRVLVAGDGPMRAALDERIEARGLAASIAMLGRTDRVGDVLAAADLFVLPSFFEGLPLAVLEAMAAGLPVVATRIGGSEDAVVDGVTGWLVPPGDPVALADAIDAALADATVRACRGRAGQARYHEQFTAGRMARETEDVYRRVLGSVRPEGRFKRMDRLRIGFIGAGGIAHRHLGVLRQFDDVEIVALADAELGRAEEAASELGARPFADFRAMLDATRLDAVHVCVPPFAHGAIEDELVERGLPFFVEKPVALDLETAERIAAGVQAKNLVTAVGYHWRYLDTVEEARSILADNPAQLVSGYWLDATPPPRWWWKKTGSGGQMVEQTTHILDLARHLVGEVTTVYGLAGHTARDDHPELDVPTASTASLHFATGAVGNIASTCLLRWGHRIGLHLFGDGLAIELTDRDIMIDVGRGRPYRGAEGDPVEREDRDFLDAVRGRENRIRCPYDEALKTHRLALAVARSAEIGEPVHV